MHDGTTIKLDPDEDTKDDSETIPVKSLDPPYLDDEERIVLNVGGVRHETHVSTLRNIPSTRLSNLAEKHLYSGVQKDVYFFDRHPAVFNSVIDFYRTGELHVPLEVCGAVVKRELDYWQINENHIKSCCWRNYRSYIENKRILDSFNRSLAKENHRVNFDELKGWRRFQMKIWLVLEHPRTSRCAMIYGIISLLFVVTSILGFVLETLPALKPTLTPIDSSKTNSTLDNSTTMKCDGEESLYTMKTNEYLNVLDIICTTFFTAELIIRFTFSPNKLKFVRSAMNIIDLLALVPLYMQLLFTVEGSCRMKEKLMIEIMFILRIVRMFRIFHLVKHYQALKILVYALKASVQELLMLGIFLFIGMLVFATMIYYAERKDSTSPSDQFSTIPVGFWWAIITMTTVGYGDVFPVTPIGYVVGTCCAVSGVLMVALTIPVISNNFALFYTHVRSRRGRVKPIDASKADSSSLEYESEDEYDTAKIYENARRTSNGSIILNDSKHFESILRKQSHTTDAIMENFANGDLNYSSGNRFGRMMSVPTPRYADASSMTDVIVKRDESDYFFSRTRSIKAHSDDGVMYSGETML